MRPYGTNIFSGAAALLLILGCCAGTAQAQDTSGARVMLQKIYESYEGKSELPDTEGDAFFTDGLQDLMDRDGELAEKNDEVPYIDGDLFCDCQEENGVLVLKQIKLAPPANGHARADVFFALGAETRHVGFDMADVGGKWLIDDIYAHGTDSLRQGLQQDIESKSKDGKKSGKVSDK
ncbi:MAG: DUF3828 domain-containing protein [Alphaproteobacteria bacterium]|nr:DUF3828 domain-containing protein [Alphaproteobacteria bacterium]